MYALYFIPFYIIFASPCIKCFGRERALSKNGHIALALSFEERSIQQTKCLDKEDDFCVEQHRKTREY